MFGGRAAPLAVLDGQPLTSIEDIIGDGRKRPLNMKVVPPAGQSLPLQAEGPAQKHGKRMRDKSLHSVSKDGQCQEP